MPRRQTEDSRRPTIHQCPTAMGGQNYQLDVDPIAQPVGAKDPNHATPTPNEAVRQLACFTEEVQLTRC
jgi:hypothetical protein